MRVLALWKKETRIAFASAMAYVAFTAFILIAGYMFLALTAMIARNAFSFGPMGDSLVESLFRPLFHNFGVILLFITPALTMRLFAEERRSGTMELLFTYPFRDEELLLGKFLAAVTLLAFLLLPTLLYPLFIYHYTPLEWPVIWTQYLGLLLLGSTYLAVGLWASQLTSNQIVAAMITLAMLLAFWLVGWITGSFSGSAWSDVLNQISILNHFENFAKGVLNSSDLTFYLCFIAFFLYLTLKGLQARTWWGARE